MPSSGLTTVDLTGIVVDVNGQAVSGATLVFSTGTDPSAFISNISGGGVSDANGGVTAKLNLGSNKSNRFISVSVSTQGATAATGVDVTGTTITISGSSPPPSAAPRPRPSISKNPPAPACRPSWWLPLPPPENP